MYDKKFSVQLCFVIEPASKSILPTDFMFVLEPEAYSHKVQLNKYSNPIDGRHLPPLRHLLPFPHARLSPSWL